MKSISSTVLSVLLVAAASLGATHLVEGPPGSLIVSDFETTGGAKTLTKDGSITTVTWPAKTYTAPSASTLTLASLSGSNAGVVIVPGSTTYLTTIVAASITETVHITISTSASTSVIPSATSTSTSTVLSSTTVTSSTPSTPTITVPISFTSTAAAPSKGVELGGFIGIAAGVLAVL